MSDYRFYELSDFEFFNNSSSANVNLPLELFKSVKRTKPEDELSTELNVVYTVFEILVAIIAIIGNLMVIIVFQKERKLRRRTNYYIVSLAMADFLVGLLGVPFAIMASIGLPTNLYACLFTVSLLVVLCTISIFCLVAVSVDRYWAILHPMAYSRNVRTKTAIGIISMCWVAGVIVGLLPLFGWHADVPPNQACLFVKVMDYNYLVFLYFATIITPALLLLAFYAHIYRVIVKQVRQIVTMKPVGDSSRRSSIAHVQVTPNRHHGGTMLRVLGAARKREVKATQNLSIIVLFFMICWIPLYTINCVKAFCPDCFVPPRLTFFCIILSHLNSAVNPLLYAYHLKDFRAALKNLILKILGLEIEQPPDLNYRLSLASQQRLQSLMEKRTSLQNRIYIDSPVWLRQQQQDSTKSSTISCSLNSVHQTVAAVASATADIKRDMWKIVEAPSGAEDSKCHADSIGNGSTRSLPKDKTPSITSDKVFSYDNKDFSASLNDLANDDNEVFLPTASTNDQNSSGDQQNGSSMLLEKFKSDLDQFDCYTKGLPMSDSFSDYDDAQVMMMQRNSIVPAPSDTSISAGNFSGPHSDNEFCSCSCNSSPLRYSSDHHRSSVFVIENDTNPLSPFHKPRIRKSTKLPSPFGINSARKRITRSCSCTNDHQLVSSTTNNNAADKLSPLKVVSNLIFPPVKHSSLFHIFDYHQHHHHTHQQHHNPQKDVQNHSKDQDDSRLERKTRTNSDS